MLNLDRPVFIVGSARSGTTLLRTCLERSPRLWRLGRGSKTIWDRFFHPFTRDAQDHRLQPEDATPALRDQLERAYLAELFLPQGRTGPDWERGWLEKLVPQGANPFYYDLPPERVRQWFGLEVPEGPPFPQETSEIPPFTLLPPSAGRPAAPDGVRMLDKEPSHAFRLSCLRGLFPDARFLFIVRDGREAVSSLIEAWRHPRWFFSYRVPCRLNIAGYTDRFPWGDRWWNLQLAPGWRQLVDRPLEEVCAHYWCTVNEALLEVSEAWDAQGRALTVRYDQLLAQPEQTLARIAGFIEVPEGDLLGGQQLPVVSTSTPPRPDKWRSNAGLIERILDRIAGVQRSLGYQDSLKV